MKHPILIVFLILLLVISISIGVLSLKNVLEDTKDVTITGKVTVSSILGWSITVDDIKTRDSVFPFGIFDWFLDPYLPFIQTDDVIVKAFLGSYQATSNLGHKTSIYDNTPYEITIKNVPPDTYTLILKLYEGDYLRKTYNYGEVVIE